MMVKFIERENAHDPIQALDAALGRAWTALCRHFNVTASLPATQALFEGVNPDDPCEAADQVFVNMLDCIMESVDRFSPWYRRPARAYGLMPIKDSPTQPTRWVLAPEAWQLWEGLVLPLAQAIAPNRAVIQATRLVDQLMNGTADEDPYITVRCQCLPLREIHVRRSILTKTDLICDNCRQPFG